MNSFFDSNVLIYLVEQSVKSARAQALIQEGGTISVQVLNEFVSVCRRKHKLNFAAISAFLEPVKETLSIVDLTRECHDRALEIAIASKFDIYDANILAAAELANCDVLYTEDMQHGQRVGRVEIRNPFV